MYYVMLYHIIIIKYHISYHIISLSYHISYHIISYHIISYHIPCHVISYHIQIILYHIYHIIIILYHILYHIIFKSYCIIYIISYHISYHFKSYYIIHIINQSIHWHEQNAVIPCRSQEPPPFLPIIHFFLPHLSANHSSILPHFIQPSISWSASWSYCFQIHVQYSFGNPIFFHSLYMSKPT